MFRDAREELERLERQLQEAEDTCREEEYEGLDYEDDEEAVLEQQDPSMPEDDPAFYRNYANDYTVYNTDRTDVDLEQYSEEVRQPRSTGIGGLLVLAALLLAAIACALVYLVLKLRGVL